MQNGPYGHESRREARDSERLLYTWHAGGVYVNGTLISQGDSQLSSHLSIFHSSVALYRTQVCVWFAGTEKGGSKAYLRTKEQGTDPVGCIISHIMQSLLHTPWCGIHYPSFYRRGNQVPGPHGASRQGRHSWVLPLSILFRGGTGNVSPTQGSLLASISRVRTGI